VAVDIDSPDYRVSPPVPLAMSFEDMYETRKKRALAKAERGKHAAEVEQHAAESERQTRSWLGRLSSALIPEETMRTMTQVNMLFGVFFHDVEDGKLDVIMGLLLLSCMPHR
jgi:hypothetical protein